MVGLDEYGVRSLFQHIATICGHNCTNLRPRESKGLELRVYLSRKFSSSLLITMVTGVNWNICAFLRI